MYSEELVYRGSPDFLDQMETLIGVLEKHPRDELLRSKVLQMFQSTEFKRIIESEETLAHKYSTTTATPEENLGICTQSSAVLTSMNVGSYSNSAVTFNAPPPQQIHAIHSIRANPGDTSAQKHIMKLKQELLR